MEIWSVVVFCKNTEDFVICHKDVLLILINELFDKCLRVIGKEEMMNDTSSFALFQGNFINFFAEYSYLYRWRDECNFNCFTEIFAIE